MSRVLLNFSRLTRCGCMQNTGRPMVFALCRGPYQQQEKWGYAPDVAQVRPPGLQINIPAWLYELVC